MTMTRHDGDQRLRQLERTVAELKRQLDFVRNQRRPATGLVSSQLCKTTGAIAGRTVDGAGFDISYGECELWDISQVDATDAANMELVEDGSSNARTILVGNPWEADIATDTFLWVIPYKVHFIAIAEECPPAT